MIQSEEAGTVGIKALTAILSVIAVLIAAGSSAGVAIYKADAANEHIRKHVDLPGHALVMADVRYQQTSLKAVEKRLELLQQQADKNERNQIRICTAVGANCEQ